MRQLWIAGAIAIGFASMARADGIGVVAVSTTGEAGPVRKALAGVAAEGRQVRVVDDAVGDARAAITAGAVPITTLERFRRVREQIDDAWRAFLRVQVEFAASRLASARTEAEALVALPGGAALYADASLRLGAVLVHLGRGAEAQAVLALALALDPERPITIAEFSPDIIAAVDAVRAQTRPAQPVRIASVPAGALVNVDGKDLGAAPLTAELTSGQHVIVARTPQFRPRALAVAIDDTTRSVDLELERDIGWSQLAEGPTPGLADARAQELVDAAIRFADLDEIVLAAETDRRGGPTLLVQRCSGLPARCTAVVEVGYSERAGLVAAAREAWREVRSADLRYAPSVLADPRVTGKKLDERCKLCRSPFLWGGIAGAALITTIVVIAVTSGSRPAPIVGVDPTHF